MPCIWHCYHFARHARGRRAPVWKRVLSDRRTAMNRLRDAGVVICSAESVVFEWCEKSGTDEFRVISRLVR